MIRFESDYTQGAVPQIIEKLTETNMEQTPGYGMDKYCIRAASKIKEKLQCENADVHFLVGGTQTNLLFISSVLRPYQGVISSSVGHINVHETGSIENCGHKVLTIDSFDGKITAEAIDNMVLSHFADSNFEHTVQPGMVYLSFPTENGAVYSKRELARIYDVCKKHSIYLFIDGARLGYGLASEKCDISYSEFPTLCDAFYIGGTKVGALFGEALVITNDSCKKDFRYMEKQKGAMLAKGRLLGLQFDTLFTDDLYEKISKHAISLAMEIRNTFLKKKIPLYYDSYTNQQFPSLTKEQYEKLNENFVSSYWCEDEDRIVARFCTSWATKKEDAETLIRAIEQL